MKRILVGAGFLVVLAVIIGMNVSRSRNKGLPVELWTVGRKDLVARVSGSGRVEARKSVSITSNVVGKVLELAANEGDRVEKGQLILRIDPGERRALLEQSRAIRARTRAGAKLAEAEFRQAEFELKRIRSLRANDLASEQALEGAQTGHDVQVARLAEAREEVRNAEAGVDHAEYELGKTVIHAEISGVIVRLSVEEGENVLAGDLYNPGSPIVIIADLSEMEAQILVDETEVVDIRLGQAAKITVDAFPDLELVGRVTKVGSSAYNAGPLGSQEAKDFRIRILLEGVPENFRPGLSARAEIVTNERDDAVAVPIEALTIRDPEKEAEHLARHQREEEPESSADSGEVDGVFVYRDGTAVFTEVETGIAGEKDFEVVAGLSVGDQVVRGPFDSLRKLESGQKVKLKKKDAKKDESPGEGEDS